MPYPRNIDHLEELVHQAAETDEIEKWLPETGLNIGDLDARISEIADRIWEAGAEQIAEFDTIDARIAALQRESTDAAPGPSPLLRLLKNASENALAPVNLLLRPLVDFLDSGHHRSVQRFRARYEYGSRVPELIKRGEEASTRADEAVIRAGIIPAMRGIINQELRKS